MSYETVLYYQDVGEGGIFIEIDEITDCLYTAYGARVETFYKENTDDYFEDWDEDIDFSAADFISEDSDIIRADIPRFHWAEHRSLSYPHNRTHIYELYAEGDDRAQGRIAIVWDGWNPPLIDLVEVAPWNSRIWQKFARYDIIEQEYYGVGAHLFAVAVHEAYERGLSGKFVFRVGTLELQKHYCKMLGAISNPYDDYGMILPEDAAQEIHDKYFGEYDE